MIFNLFQHSLYFQKFNKANTQSRLIALNISSCKFTNSRNQIEFKKKLKVKEEKLSLNLNDDVIKQMKLNKVI